MLVIKQSATYLKDLKITGHFPPVQAILQTQSLVPTCRKNRGFSASGVCECILNKPKYGTNIRLSGLRLKLHSLKDNGTTEKFLFATFIRFTYGIPNFVFLPFHGI